jgi:hypothetical protein
MRNAEGKPHLRWYASTLVLGVVCYFYEEPIRALVRDGIYGVLHLRLDDYLLITMYLAFSIWLEDMREKLPKIVPCPNQCCSPDQRHDSPAQTWC